MTRILVFYPSNQRTVQLETTIIAIHRTGIEIELLTTCERGALHEFLDGQGVPTYAHPISKRPAWVYYARHAWHLASFCRQRRITTVFSNLQHANLIAVFAQYLMRAQVVAFRHHFKFVHPGDGIVLQRNQMERIFDRVINQLARTIVVPSTGVYNGMLESERVHSGHVSILPYIYDFDQYDRPDPDAVAAIRAQFPARLTLLVSGRLIPFKRPALVFSVVRDLVLDGLDIRLLVLGDGPQRSALEEFVRVNELDHRIIMLGFRTDFINYMSAADLLIHPSLTEASSSVVKEMALLGKTAIVCEGVGDFDEYVEHGRNGFLVPRSTEGREIAEILREVYTFPDRLTPTGRALRQTVLARFAVTPESVDRYIKLAESRS